MISDTDVSGRTGNLIRRGEVSKLAKMNADILIAPAMAIERGHNIVDEKGHSALGSVFFLVRPMSVPDDVQEQGSKLNGYIESTFKREDKSVLEFNSMIRAEATKRWRVINESTDYGLAGLSAEEQKDIVATLFVVILQIFGRLARITDTSRPEPHIYFVDGAFRKPKYSVFGFDTIDSLTSYLENLILSKETEQIAKTLYEPFYVALKKGVNHG